MKSFWDKTSQKQSSKKEVYLVNNIECTVDTFAEVVRKLTLLEGEINLKKRVTCIDESGNTDNLSFGLRLGCFALNKVAITGLNNYQKLIALILCVLDSGVEAQRNFGANVHHFEKHITAYYMFLSTFFIVKNSPFFSEIQHMYSEYMCLIATDLVFALSRLGTHAGEMYCKQYGVACVPVITLPMYDGKKSVDADEAKALIEDIIANAPLLKNQFIKSNYYIPSAKEFTLQTLINLEEMAQKYSKVFDEFSPLFANNGVS
jgi:hypothetical protein